MKLLSVLTLLLTTLSFSQEDESFHRHKGFFISISSGFAGGSIDLNMQNNEVGINEIKFYGLGGAFDFKIGGAIRENTILSFDIIGRTITGPQVEVDGNTGSASNNVTVNDGTLGIGITQYFMPHNFFVSATLGAGNFTVENKDLGTNSGSELGLSVYLKVGKEWWVSRNWGLGIAGGFNHISAEDKKDLTNPAYSGTISTNKLFLLFNTTFN